MLEEPAGVARLAGRDPQRLLELGERAGDAEQVDAQHRQRDRRVHPEQARPAQPEQPPDDHQHDHGAVQQRDGGGEEHVLILAAGGRLCCVYDADPVALLCRERLRERTAALLAEACAWAVGLSDRPHLVRRGARLVADGTLGVRAALGLPLGDDDGRLDLGDARPGSFPDALNALTPEGRLYAEQLDELVVAPFVLDTCVQAAQAAAQDLPQVWADLLDDLGEDGTDLPAVVRAAEWEAPLRTEAEQLVLAALRDAPLVEVEAEGLPLSLVRAAEAELRRASAPPPEPAPVDDEALAGALFLAEVAVREAGLPVPVPPEAADRLLDALLAEGLEKDEVLEVLPHLPVLADTADEVAATVRVLPDP